MGLQSFISQYGTPAEPLHHVSAPSVVLSELVTAFLARGILSFLKVKRIAKLNEHF